MTGGGGPKADLLTKMIAEESLESRVEMVGPVPHEKARDLLVTLLVMIPAWCALVAAWCADVVSSAYLLLHITLSSCRLTGNRGAHGTTTTSTIAWATFTVWQLRSAFITKGKVGDALQCGIWNSCTIVALLTPLTHFCSVEKISCIGEG